MPDRLRLARDVRAAAAARARSRAPGCAVRGLVSSDGPRAAVIAGRAVGGAVQRNRAKRRIRAALAEIGVPHGLDVVVIARPGIERVGADELVAGLEDAIRDVREKAGVAA